MRSGRWARRWSTTRCGSRRRLASLAAPPLAHAVPTTMTFRKRGRWALDAGGAAASDLDGKQAMSIECTGSVIRSSPPSDDGQSSKCGALAPSKRSPDERSDIRDFDISFRPRISHTLMRATYYCHRNWRVSFQGCSPARDIRTCVPDGQISGSVLIQPVQSHSKKYCSSRFTQIKSIILAIPSRSEGRFAIVTNAGRDAVDVAVSLTNGTQADGEVVWS